jgi:peptidyl-prolyl cis-trans isomerase C
MRSTLIHRLGLCAIGLCAALYFSNPAVAADKTKGAEKPKAAAKAKTDTKAEARAAEVNGTVISKSDLEKAITSTEQRFQGMGYSLDEAKRAEMQKQVLDGLIGEELLYQETRSKGITVDKAAVASRMEELKKQFPNEADYKAMLTKFGLTEDGVRGKIAKSMAIEQFVDTQVASKITVTDAETKAFYDGNPTAFAMPEQVRARHILIKVDKNADEATKKAAKEKTEGILAEAKKGGDFAELATKNSQDSSAAKGGDLGFFSKEQMVAPFADAAFALKPGEISSVVETPFGFHIIKSEEKKAASTVPYETAKERITQYLKQQEVQKKVQALVDELKAKAKIKIFNS